MAAALRPKPRATPGYGVTSQSWSFRIRWISETVLSAPASSWSLDALLTGWSITEKSYPSAPKTRDINSAALTKFRVITPTAGTPSRSAAIASCKLHDEQLPQSPRPDTASCQAAAASTM